MLIYLMCFILTLPQHRNAVELIVAILALVKKEVLIVQTSLIGSILSNLLLVMGMAFFLGGVNRIEQFFNVTVAQTAASLLALAIGSLIIPGAFGSFSSSMSLYHGNSKGSPLTSVCSWVGRCCAAISWHCNNIAACVRELSRVSAQDTHINVQRAESESG